MGPLFQFNWNDYLLALPITLLVLFALGILLIDFMLPDDMKRLNAVTAFIGVCFSAAGVLKIQMTLPNGAVGMLGTMHVDRIAMYFFYLFLAGTAIAILISVRYLETEHENHGEYYALLLLSVAGMMCMAAGFDVVLIFIGLELMAISTYVLVGFLRRDRRSVLRRHLDDRHGVLDRLGVDHHRGALVARDVVAGAGAGPVRVDRGDDRAGEPAAEGCHQCV